MNTNTTLIAAEYLSTDHSWADDTTTHWFQVDGEHVGTGCEISGSFGVSVCDGVETIVDADGAPLTAGDWDEIAVRSVCVVTAKIRAEAQSWKLAKVQA